MLLLFIQLLTFCCVTLNLFAKLSWFWKYSICPSSNLTAKGLYDLDVKIITDNKEIINYLEMLGSQDLRPENEEDYIQFENSIDYEIGNGTTYKIEIRTTTKKAQSEIDNLIKNL